MKRLNVRNRLRTTFCQHLKVGLAHVGVVVVVDVADVVVVAVVVDVVDVVAVVSVVARDVQVSDKACFLS